MSSHLIAKCEHIVVKRQSDRADHHVLVQGLVPKRVHEAVTRHTFAVSLIRERKLVAS